MSRREFLRSSGTAGAAIVVGASAAQAGATEPVLAALEPGRMPKADAAYQDTPKGTQRCADCVLFIAPNTCATVAGDISANGWCKFFAARAP
jgi:hypothetical protein